MLLLSDTILPAPTVNIGLEILVYVNDGSDKVPNGSKPSLKIMAPVDGVTSGVSVTRALALPGTILSISCCKTSISVCVATRIPFSYSSLFCVVKLTFEITLLIVALGFKNIIYIL